jgi:hypothetical protein
VCVEVPEGVGGDEAVKGEDLEHLQGHHQRAAALSNDVRNCQCQLSSDIEPQRENETKRTERWKEVERYWT